MVTKIHLAILFFVALASVFSTCKKNLGCANSTYSFETNIKARSTLDSLHVNDTIWLEYSAPVQLMDTALHTTIDYSGAENLGTAISFDELIGGSVMSPGAKDAANSFDVVSIIGRPTASLTSSRIRNFIFEESSGLYRFKLAILPKMKGIFCFSPSDAVNVYRRTDKCTKAHFNITFKDTDQHMYLYQQNRPGYTPSQYEMTHMYCFKVN